MYSSREHSILVMDTCITSTSPQRVHLHLQAKVESSLESAWGLDILPRGFGLTFSAVAKVARIREDLERVTCHRRAVKHGTCQEQATVRIGPVVNEGCVIGRPNG